MAISSLFRLAQRAQTMARLLRDGGVGSTAGVGLDRPRRWYRAIQAADSHQPADGDSAVLPGDQAAEAQRVRAHLGREEDAMFAQDVKHHTGEGAEIVEGAAAGRQPVDGDGAVPLGDQTAGSHKVRARLDHEEHDMFVQDVKHDADEGAEGDQAFRRPAMPAPFAIESGAEAPQRVTRPENNASTQPPDITRTTSDRLIHAGTGPAPAQPPDRSPAAWAARLFPEVAKAMNTAPLATLDRSPAAWAARLFPEAAEATSTVTPTTPDHSPAAWAAQLFPEAAGGGDPFVPSFTSSASLHKRRGLHLPSVPSTPIPAGLEADRSFEPSERLPHQVAASFPSPAFTHEGERADPERSRSVQAIGVRPNAITQPAAQAPYPPLNPAVGGGFHTRKPLGSSTPAGGESWGEREGGFAATLSQGRRMVPARPAGVAGSVLIGRIPMVPSGPDLVGEQTFGAAGVTPATREPVAPDTGLWNGLPAPWEPLPTVVPASPHSIPPTDPPADRPASLSHAVIDGFGAAGAPPSLDLEDLANQIYDRLCRRLGAERRLFDLD